MITPELQVDPRFQASADTIASRGSCVGQDMGGFWLHQEIASGGMASVYLAYKEGHLGLGQIAAIKVMHPHLARRREYVNMFLDEARISACINHPNVVRVYDFGQEDGSYYLAMEHLTGKTWYDVWRTTLNRGMPRELRLLPVLAASLLGQACEGLHAAHEARDLSGNPLNVVHRDISPQNVFITFDGHVRVLDFGIALSAQRLHVTLEGAIKGRIAYMSPEQMGSKPTDRRSDVWSMGVLLWEALAQQRLFARIDDAATIAAVVGAHVPPLPARAADVPQELLAIALKALQRNPGDRFATALEMADALSSFVSKRARLSPSAAMDHMQALFADDIAKQLEQRAAAAEALSMLTTQNVVTKVKPLRSVPAPPDPKPEHQHESERPACEPSESQPLPTRMFVSHQAAMQAETVQKRKKLSLALVALVVTVGGLGSALWLTRPMPSNEQRVELSKPALSEGAPSAPLMVVADSATNESSNRRSVPSEEQEEEAPASIAASDEPEPSRSRLRSETRSRTRTRLHAQSAAGRSRREPTANKAPRGALNVTTPGCWAVVYANGQRIGMSPGRFSLPAGRHEIELAMQGKSPHKLRSAEVRSGKTDRLRVDCR